jgi:branched-chain amino acid aminotransferase
MSVVWLNGALVEDTEARIDPADRGFTLGDGLFETIRAVDGVPAYAARHLARLRTGAEILGLPVAWTDTQLLSALCGVLAANHFANAALRLTLTRGPAARGVLPVGDIYPTTLITAGALPALAGPAWVVVAHSVRRNEFSPLAHIKSLNYLDSIIARREAAARGADDALLLNTQGFLAEASAATIVLHIDGAWVTPPIADGALPGVMRGVILENRAVHEMRITMEALRRTHAAFLANSLGYQSLLAIDEVTLRGAEALTTLALQSLF